MKEESEEDMKFHLKSLEHTYNEENLTIRNEIIIFKR